MHTFQGFVAGKLFEIPLNQRGYSWTVRNSDDLFDDLLLADKTAHYLGPVIVSRDTTAPDFPDDDLTITAKFILEDGQQRLATFFIVIVANEIRKSLEALNSGAPDRPTLIRGSWSGLFSIRRAACSRG